MASFSGLSGGPMQSNVSTSRNVVHARVELSRLSKRGKMRRMDRWTRVTGRREVARMRHSGELDRDIWFCLIDRTNRENLMTVALNRLKAWELNKVLKPYNLVLIRKSGQASSN